MKLILDFGSGNTCNNDLDYIKKMIDELDSHDPHTYEIIIKWQLFSKAFPNKPLSHRSFKYAYHYAKTRGYQTTASIFDKESLRFLLKYNIPFVKISNNENTYNLIDKIPRGTQIIVSTSKVTSELEKKLMNDDIIMLCVSKYPATVEDYNIISNGQRIIYISDHTVGLDLIKQHKPDIVEKHYKLKDSTGLDAGGFAITPEQLGEGELK